MPGQTWPDVATAFAGMWLVRWSRRCCPRSCRCGAPSPRHRRRLSACRCRPAPRRCAYRQPGRLFPAPRDRHRWKCSVATAREAAMIGVDLTCGIQFSALKAHHLVFAANADQAARRSRRRAWHGTRVACLALHCCFTNLRCRSSSDHGSGRDGGRAGRLPNGSRRVDCASRGSSAWFSLPQACT